MDLNRAGDDELHRGPGRRRRSAGTRERERLVGVADVQHDLRARPLADSPRSIVLPSNGSEPVVDEADFALGAGDRDLVGRRAARRSPFSVPTTQGTPSSRLTMAAWQVRPPRLVTIAAAIFMVGSQSGSVMSATSTSPGWKSCKLVDVADDAHRPGADLLADAAALEQHLALSVQPVDLQRVALRASAMDRLGPGLEDEQLAGRAVLGPLDVHRRGLAAPWRVVVLDQAAPAGQRQHVVVASG